MRSQLLLKNITDLKINNQQNHVWTYLSVGRFLDVRIFDDMTVKVD